MCNVIITVAYIKFLSTFYFIPNMASFATIHLKRTVAYNTLYLRPVLVYKV